MYYIWSCYGQAFSNVAGQNTKKAFLKILAWSCRWLLLGRWPTHDHNDVEYPENSPGWKLAYEVYHLAGGFRAVIFSLIGDLDYHTKFWELENHNSTVQPCYYCPCNLTDVNWRNFLPTAAWVAATYTNAQWIAAHPDRLAFLALPWVTVLTVCSDWMHVKYLGTDQYFFGSVLHYMVFTMMRTRGTPDQNMITVMNMLRDFFRENRVGCCFKHITVRMFSNKD